MAYLGSVASEPFEYSVGRGSGSLESHEFQIAYLGDSRIANSESCCISEILELRIRNLAEFWEFPELRIRNLAEFSELRIRNLAELRIGILRIADDGDGSVTILAAVAGRAARRL